MKLLFVHNGKKYRVSDGKIKDEKNKVAIIYSPEAGSRYSGDRKYPYLCKQIIEAGGEMIFNRQLLKIKMVPENMKYLILFRGGYELLVMEKELHFETA